MKIELKLIINCPTLENLLEPFVHEFDLENFHFYPCYVELMQLRFIFQNLTRFRHEDLVPILKP
jgi:hypothetical protein